MYEVPQTIYQGRKWDSPMTDEAIRGTVTGDCDMCQEPILPEDNALQLPLMKAHLECHLRAGLGSVEHLEGRCSCSPGGPHEKIETQQTYREEARETLRWMLTHYRGRFHPEGTE